MSEFDRRLAVAIEAERNVAAARGGLVDLAAVRADVLDSLSDAELIEVITRGLAGNADAKHALAQLVGRLGQVLAGLVVRVGNVELVLANVRVVEEARLWAPDGVSQTG